MSDLYEVLQVRRGAEPEVIRAAYRALARKNHPDFGGRPERMAQINEAWAVLGNATRRAAYDATPQSPTTDRSGTAHSSTSAPDNQPVPQASHGLSGRRPVDPAQSGSVLDFGRYNGWTVATLVNHDPDYLEWLARTPIGRRLSNEIAQALARRNAEQAALTPSPKQGQRRSFGRPWAVSHSAR